MNEKRMVVWLFGRGLSIECALSWSVPSAWKVFPREDRVAKIKARLLAEMDSPDVDIRVLRRFLDLLKQTARGWRHLFITTNWDFLLQRELGSMFSEVPHWLRDTHVFHFNGTVEVLPDNSRRSDFLLEDDGPELRTRSFRTHEAREAFNRMTWESVFVVVGMSFECQPDRFLLRYLGRVKDMLPIGGSDWIIVNRDEDALNRVRELILAELPNARVECVARRFSDWLNARLPELGAKGVF